MSAAAHDHGMQTVFSGSYLVTIQQCPAPLTHVLRLAVHSGGVQAQRDASLLGSRADQLVRQAEDAAEVGHCPTQLKHSQAARRAPPLGPRVLPVCGKRMVG